ncbi:uroporphyrinogen-III C-methyltransferase [Pseudenhygromyxa sp. WMMC2535]|uniref:uroporphyrinogen-III C-methyltransferase n=1 Tax=Pseudenhygromyxa sp. WMMC2535 TaxID=2712867 RepID=UPI001554CDD0|nr:uroporphyrinogen-III C-methyltransferase [Pseudenhygromyxa sp. WMMC2535]NVB40799.1 uroporphyrinogen-III C-methyltransferase [Pseudenhygromyxa sp. WMMC2535]
MPEGGFVSLVGAGPWDPELLTLAARDRIRRADVLIVDYLVNPAVLMHARGDAKVFQRARGPHESAGLRLDQARVNALMVEHAQAGARVVRLKGGDPMVFGRGAEEARYLRERGVDFEFVPGVSSPIAAPEAAGIPITHRDHTPSVSFVSGYEAYEKAGLAVAWDHLAQSAGTLVLMMSVKNARTNADKLIAAGREPSTPAAVVRWGTRGIQQTVVGSLADIAERMAEAGIRAPAVMIVGDVVGLREHIAWIERRPLFGRRVVVTRAARQAGGLVHELAAAGADAVAFPCLDFVDPGEEARAAIDRALSRESLASLRGVIVSSPNAADALFEALDRLELDVRSLAHLQVAAIGTGTARRCQARGLRPDIIPDRARAEGLIDALDARGLLGARWLQIRADEGRALLGRAIAAAGGELVLTVGYRTIRPEVPALLLRSLRAAADGGEGFDAVAFASGRTARHFLETLGEGLGEDEARALLAAAKVVAIGPVTADAIAALGVRVDAVSKTPSEAGVVAAIVECLKSTA